MSSLWKSCQGHRPTKDSFPGMTSHLFVSIKRGFVPGLALINLECSCPFFMGFKISGILWWGEESPEKFGSCLNKGEKNSMLGIQLKALMDLQLTIQYFPLSLSLAGFLLLSRREKVLENMENMGKLSSLLRQELRECLE